MLFLNHVDIRCKSLSSTELLVSWDTPSDKLKDHILKYEIVYAPEYFFFDIEKQQHINTSDNEIILRDLKAETFYLIDVRGLDSAGNYVDMFKLVKSCQTDPDGKINCALFL